MLFIYSGEVPTLDQRLAALLGPEPTFTMIPFSPEELWSAKEAAAWFNEAGIRSRSLSAAYYRNPRRLQSAIAASDGVYLCGGNTYEFLEFAREINLFPMLHELEARGGVIGAESAGSILLSPDIATAGIPGSDADPNTPGLTDLAAMGRIPFHVSPHFDPDSPAAAQDLMELQDLADESGRDVLVLEDGQGVILRGQEILERVGAPLGLQPRGVQASAFVPVEVAAVPGGQPPVPALCE